MQETIIMLPLCRVSAKALTDFSWGLRKHVRGRAHGILRLGAGVSRADETDRTPAASVCGDYCTGGSIATTARSSRERGHSADILVLVGHVWRG